MKKLSVKASGQALVPDYEALDAGVLRFVGRQHDAAVGVNGGWVPRDEASTVPDRVEYRQELRAGALLPCDAETAAAAGVPFTTA